jgi:hypothetical protein
VRIKVLPFLDHFGRTRLRRNDGLSLWPELPKCFAMAVVWFVLRDHHDIWLIDLGKVLNTGRDVVRRACEPFLRNNRLAREPWVDQDRVCTIRRSQVACRRLCFWREDEEEAGISVQVLDRQ